MYAVVGIYIRCRSHRSYIGIGIRWTVLLVITWIIG